MDAILQRKSRTTSHLYQRCELQSTSATAETGTYIITVESQLVIAVESQLVLTNLNKNNGT